MGISQLYLQNALSCGWRGLEILKTQGGEVTADTRDLMLRVDLITEPFRA